MCILNNVIVVHIENRICFKDVIYLLVKVKEDSRSWLLQGVSWNSVIHG